MFVRLSNIAHRYRKFISIIETYSIDNIDFLAPKTVINSQKKRTLFDKCPSLEWLQRRVGGNSCTHDSMHFWAVMGYNMQ